VISDATRSAVTDLMTRFPEKRGALLPALHLVQRELGHVAPETAVEVAELFDLHPVDVLELLRFYNLLHDTPQPRHHVAVCTNLSCSLRGARGLLRQLEAHLGVRTRWLLGDIDHLLKCLRRPAERRQIGSGVMGLLLSFALSFVDGTRTEIWRRDDRRPFLRELWEWIRNG